MAPPNRTQIDDEILAKKILKDEENDENKDDELAYKDSIDTPPPLVR